MVSSTGTFVSCKDYDDDIDELTSRVDGIESQIKDLEAKINAANWITSVTPATGGFTVAFNDGSSYTITNGKDGEAGAAGTEWTISEDGFWVCNGEKTTVKAVGQDGAQGEPGKDAQPEVKKENGKWYLWNGTEFEEFAGATAPAANIPFYYTDPTDPNYNILVIYDENGKEPLEIRLPMAADLGQIVVLGEKLDINYHRFNGLHTNKEGQVKEATWDGSKAMPAKGQYMLTANQDYVYVQVVPSNYDISKLNFKLVNTKGDEAPVVFGTPVPTNDAINNSRAISESGVFAIPYSLKDMTPAEMKTYEKNIKGKALSLVASENVRSIYNYGVELKQASNKNSATFKDRTIPVDSIGEPVTIVPEGAGDIYDSYLVMADDEAKADSVRYGISIDGMTFSYKETIKGQAVKFTVRQVTNTAMVVTTNDPVTVTFGKEAPETTEIILAEQAHNAVATYTNAAGQKIANQFIIADFAPYFAKVAPTAGDRL